MEIKKNNIGKAPFSERWRGFKEAYFAWARYNSYKDDPCLKFSDYWKDELVLEEKPKDIVETITVFYDKATSSARLKYNQDEQRRKIRVRAKKSRLRKNLKQAFLDLF